jgi:hypothetical protein
LPGADMNWKRGFFRLAMVVAIFVLPPIGLYGWMQWQIAEQREELVVPDAKVITRIPDARIISRSQIPTTPEWPFPWRLAVAFGAAGFVLGVGASWVTPGFRAK